MFGADVIALFHNDVLLPSAQHYLTKQAERMALALDIIEGLIESERR